MQFYKSWSLLFLSFTSIQTDAFSNSLLARNQNSLSENYRYSTSDHILFATKEQTVVEETTIFDTKKIIVECKDGNERLEENIQPESSKCDGDEEEDESPEDEVDEAEVERRRKAVIAAKLLKSPSSSRSRSAAVSESQVKKALGRKTSVGVRREGSTSRARRGLAGSILRGVKAGALSAKKKEKKDNDENGEGGTKAVKKTIIESTIDALIQSQRPSKDISSIGLLGNREASTSTSTPSTLKRYGPDRFGHEYGSQHLEISIVPEPGTLLVSKSLSKENSNNNASPIPMDSKMRIRQHTLVRTATMKDDLDIAKLRLSVFSDFTPEIRRQFRHRSVEVLGNRRLKGATCLVASVRYDDVDANDICNDTDERKDWVIGSVECSTHEFVNTELGARRPAGSVLYITEVAVSPRVRRAGAGTKLLQGIDELAKIRNVETIYLHVDVANDAACELYKKSGYEILDSKDPVYNDFTTKLNLHDGATKGRNHHLLHKKIQAQQTWIEPELNEEKEERRVLGFDILD